MVRERDEERAAEGKLHSEVISLKDSIRPSEVSIVHARTRARTQTPAWKLANTDFHYRCTEPLRAHEVLQRMTLAPVKSI